MPYVKRMKGPEGEPIAITITGVYAGRLRAWHRISQVGVAPGAGRTSLEKFCLEIIEGYLADKRGLRLVTDADQYWERDGDDASHVAVD
jgi:hypothetical protein